jgi:hypothetical protein
LILAQSLLIFSSSLLRSRKLLLQFTILRDGDATGDQRYNADNYQAPGDRNEETDEGLRSAAICNSMTHRDAPLICVKI